MECKQLKQVEHGVRVWREEVIIPTYPVGKPERNPVFLEKRVYQGSSGKVYPHPVIESIGDEPQDAVYQALCLENKYLFIMVLPELGGRIQRAYDKTNGYDFVYYNQVIKPALVGLAGPWISGGIEFNWPQHHRPSTFDPVDSEIFENPDGSCTIAVGEIENMFRTKGLAKMTLFPDSAALKIDVRLYNRTPLPQTFLWWANPAVAVNENTQSIFPPDVTAVMDHGKRDVSSFPIARGVYYKQDYSAGVDISRYKNIPVPTSYMAYRSKYDFIGGYDYGRRAGLLHVADHHISPGKKQWTWGCGEFGKAWDRNLTDEDGPYIELMTGCFTDNQPDFSWLMPYEEKSFTQYFMPYREIGAVKNANTEAAVSLELTEGTAHFGVYATKPIPNAEIVLTEDGRRVFSARADLSPEQLFTGSANGISSPESALELTVLDSNGARVISYRPEAPKTEPLPEPAKPVPSPEDAATNEDLFLYGTHLEQYRHATYLPEDYYLEGLRRDPTDARINNAYGLLLLRRGCLEEAESHFQAAIAKLTRSNPNPYDGEAYYNLGVCQRLQNKIDAAYDSFYKATWNAAQQECAFYEMACIQAEKADFAQALAHVERALVRNAHHMKARGLKCALLRSLNRQAEAACFAMESLEIDPLDLSAQYELTLAGDTEQARALGIRLKQNANWVIELALDYAAAGFFSDAIAILKANLAEKPERAVYPMIYYYLAVFADRAGQKELAETYRALAAKAEGDPCFPHRVQDILVLRKCLERNPRDSRGCLYLGNCLYDKRRYDEAILAWERCRELDERCPTARRNLALAYFNKRGEKESARRELEAAFALDTNDARVLMELDQLYKKIGVPPEERLAFLRKHRDCAFQRDDLYVEYVTLLNLTNQPEEALNLIEARRFHPWEGGEGRVIAQYITSLVQLAKKCIQKKEFADAVELLKRATVYPENLGEGKLAGAKENDIYYWLGVAYKGLGQAERADACFVQAAQGDEEPAGMMYYNDQPPEMAFYKGLALRALGREGDAARCFGKLVDYGQAHENDTVKIDYFAVSLPDLMVFDEDLNARNRAHCRFMTALGLLGDGKTEPARELLTDVLRGNPNHLSVKIHLELLEWNL
jgi:tetratricopeptide (TPR) repeat protein